MLILSRKFRSGAKNIIQGIWCKSFQPVSILKTMLLIWLILLVAIYGNAAQPPLRAQDRRAFSPAALDANPKKFNFRSSVHPLHPVIPNAGRFTYKPQ